MRYRMEQSRKKMKFEVLFERYFSNFPRILLANLIFFVPLSIAMSIFYSGYFLLGLNAPLPTIALVVALSTLFFPFYAGLVLVCRNIARGDEKVKVFSTFMKGLKENFSKFFLYGFLVSLITVFSYISIFIYSQMLSQMWIFYVALFICILIVVAILFIFFYVPVMSVTFDLSVKNILRNSFLMSFGEIKNNLRALLASVVVLAFCFTLVAFATYDIAIVIITILIFALLLPASVQFVICYYIYDDMYATIAQHDEKSKVINEKITQAQKKRNGESSPVVDTEDYSDVDISTLKDSDEFIFYKGKMIKQSDLLNKVLQQKDNQ